MMGHDSRIVILIYGRGFIPSFGEAIAHEEKKAEKPYKGHTWSLESSSLKETSSIVIILLKNRNETLIVYPRHKRNELVQYVAMQVKQFGLGYNFEFFLGSHKLLFEVLVSP